MATLLHLAGFSRVTSGEPEQFVELAAAVIKASS